MVDKPDLSYIAEDLRSLAVPISSINEDPHNARAHDERNIQAIADSLQRFGQRVPIVVRRDGAISEAGSGRIAAARLLGWEYLAVVWSDDDEETAKAYAIADNRTAETATWNDTILLEQLTALPDDLRDATGFSTDEVEEMLEIAEFWANSDKSDQHSGMGMKDGMDGLKAVKIVAFVDDLEVVESALRATGERSRGKALAIICEAFVDGKKKAGI